MAKDKPGWKRDADGTLVDPKTWRTRYVMRAVTFPVASPEEHGKGSTAAWAALNEVCKECWQ